MTAVLLPITALLFSVALLLMGNGLVGSLIPLRASIESFTSIEIGIMGSAYFIGFAFGCYYGPRLLRRVGHIRSFSAMVALATSAVLLHSIIVLPVLWWCLRAITGLCLAVLYLVIESWLNEKATTENRGQVFSIYTIINMTVITIGQMMLTLGEPTQFFLFALSAVLMSLAAVPVALTTSRAPGPVATIKIRFRHLSRVSPVGITGCFAVGLANGAFWGLAPIYAQGESSDVAGVAIFMSATVIAGAVGQWPLGRISDRVDRRRVMLVACFGAALAAAGLTLIVPVWGDLIFVFGFLYGMFAFPLYSLCVAHTNDHIDPGGYVEAAGGLLMIFAVGAIAGPLVAALAMELLGTPFLFAYTLCIHLATAVFIIYRIARHEGPPLEDYIPFGDALRVAQTVSTIDPLDQAEELDYSEAGQDETNSAMKIRVMEGVDDGNGSNRI